MRDFCVRKRTKFRRKQNGEQEKENNKQIYKDSDKWENNKSYKTKWNKANP